MTGRLSKAVSFAALFTSLGTLLCCAIPAFMVFLGFGASLAGLISAAPQITVFSQYKQIVIAAAVAAIVAAWLLRWLSPQTQECRIPSETGAPPCRMVREWSYWILMAASILTAISILVAYVLPLVLLP